MFGHGSHAGFKKEFGGACGSGFARFHRGWGDDAPGGGRPFGRPFGRHFGPPGARRFGRGDLKFVILDLLKDQPRHGYDVIRALEERFHGFYSPSPGSVYPTLQLLEDQGYVTSNRENGKKLYTITDEGRQFLTEQADVVDGIRSRMAAGWGPMATPEMRQLAHEVWQLGQFVFRQGARGGLNDPATVARLREVVARARGEVEVIFAGDASSETISL